ncbi:MAG: DUF1570 domain-containing protein [Planctomycetaceae bacterium]|nr:DUF1570 domain-containing protein [Planctomycetaceae bacterium]
MARNRFRLVLFALFFLLGLPAWPIYALETVTINRAGIQHVLSGRILVEAQDGGLLLETQDQIIWVIQPDEIESRQHDEREFQPAKRTELTATLLKELPPGFRIHETAHYSICYNTSKAYAQWCGALYERLYRSFYTFWKSRGLKLEPAGPLVAVVFRDKAAFRAYGQAELGEASDSIIGFYSLKTNRITSYDLTGIEALRAPTDRSGSLSQISRMLTRPAAERTVATVIHEATHQLAFNSGLQTRFADNPLWLSEGLAIYFESPDLKSRKGWRRIGAVNHFRLGQMRSYLQRRPQGSLASLLTDDQRFRDARQADDAYAEAWSLCYHLIRSRPDQFKDYLEKISAKQPLGVDPPQVRLSEFESAFGENVSKMDAEFIRAIPQWRSSKK